MKKLLQWACLALAAVAGWASALDLADIRLPMSRSYADEKLGKDYTFQILQDSSVRRIWDLDGKKVTIDFDPGNNLAICVVVAYDQPVSRKKAMADCRTLCAGKAEGAKWAKTKKEAMGKLGMEDAHVLKLSDSTYLFREDAGKNKSVRLSLYAKAPKNNRFELAPVEGDGVTAMGRHSTGNNIKALREDEQRRQNAAPAGDKSALASAEPSAAKGSADAPRRSPSSAAPVRTALGNSGAVAAADSGSGVQGAPAAGENAGQTQPPRRADNLIEALGLDHPSPVQYCIMGIIALALVMVVCGIVSASRRKARARSSFNAVSAARPMAARPAQKAPAPVLKKRQ